MNEDNFDFDYYSSFCPYNDYINRIDNTKFDENKLGVWIDFRKSFPPLDKTFILWCDGDYLSFETTFECDDIVEGYKAVRFHRIDTNQYIWINYFETDVSIYWMLVSNPPDNEQYNIG